MRKQFRRELDTAAAITNANIGTNVYNAAMRGEGLGVLLLAEVPGRMEGFGRPGLRWAGGGKGRSSLVVLPAGQLASGGEPASSPAIKGPGVASGASHDYR